MYKEIRKEVMERKRILGMKTAKYIFGADQKSPIFFQKLMDNIFDFERTRNCIVYAAIYLTLLYVSYENKDEWETEKEDLKAMEPIAYVMNLTYPELSEFGTVVLRSHDGVLERIG